MGLFKKKDDSKKVLEDKAARDKIKKDIADIEMQEGKKDSVTEERKVFLNSLNVAYSVYSGIYNPDEFLKLPSGYIEAEKFNRLMALFGEINLSNKLLNVLINEVQGLRSDIKKLNDSSDGSDNLERIN